MQLITSCTDIACSRRRRRLVEIGVLAIDDDAAASAAAVNCDSVDDNDDR